MIKPFNLIQMINIFIYAKVYYKYLYQGKALVRESKYE